MESLERWCAAVEARTEAARFAELAECAGTAAEQFDAQTALLAAQGEVDAARDAVGGEFAMAFRLALDAHEPWLNALLERLLGLPTMTLFEQRVARAEEACGWAVGEITHLRDEVRRLKRENWEIACELASLRERNGASR
jgi:hypothetical protein